MSSSDGGNNSNNNTIQLDSMSLEELHQLQQREQNLLQALTQRFATLRQAAARIGMGHRAVSDLKNSSSSGGGEVMIPLTESVYIPGTIIPEQPNLLIDLGTGYFTESSPKETLNYLDRKLKLVDANSDNITQAVQATRANLEAIQMTMQGKMLEIRARQEGQRLRAQEES